MSSLITVEVDGERVQVSRDQIGNLAPSLVGQIDRDVYALATAQSFDEVSTLLARYKGLAEAFRVYDRSYDRSNWFKAVAIRAMRRLGQLMAEMPRNAGGRPTETSSAPDEVSLKSLGLNGRKADIARKLAAIDDETFDELVGSEREDGVAGSESELTFSGVIRGAAMNGHVKPGGGSLSDEWYTDDVVLERVYMLMGDPIDLDPCSNAECGDANVRALLHWTKDDDGLSREWSGTVFVNPPYGKALGEWTAKAADEFESGRVDELLLLVPNSSATSWFHRLSAYPRCLLFRRAPFKLPDGSIGAAPPYPTMIVYMGKRNRDFARVFCDIGGIWEMTTPWSGRTAWRTLEDEQDIALAEAARERMAKSGGRGIPMEEVFEELEL